MTTAQQWLMENAYLLSRMFGGDRVVLDASSWQNLLIRDFPLPDNWHPYNSRLLIRFPALPRVFSVPPDHFYLDSGLRTVTGCIPHHYFEDSEFNDLREYGLARYSFHIKKKWKPALPCEQGTTLVHVLEPLLEAMRQAAEV